MMDMQDVEFGYEVCADDERVEDAVVIAVPPPKSCLKPTCRLYILIEVSKPKLQYSSNGCDFLTYKLSIQTNDPAFSLSVSATPRRYSEFIWLKKALRRNDVYETKLPDLPTRGLFQDRMNPTFIEERRMGLQNFLYQVTSTPNFKADKALHLFLQTNLSTLLIEKNCTGERRDRVQLPPDHEIVRNAADGYSDVRPITVLTSLTANSYNCLTGSNRSFSRRQPVPKIVKRVTFCNVIESHYLENESPMYRFF